MNDKIARLTEELRSALAEEDAVKNYIAAKAAYIADEEIVRLANEYNVQREIYETESSKEEADTLLLDSVKARLDKLYEQIAASQTAKALFESEDAINALYGEIVSRLQSLVDRRDESYSTATNLMTSISDTRSNLIRNLG